TDSGCCGRPERSGRRGYRRSTAGGASRRTDRSRSAPPAGSARSWHRRAPFRAILEVGSRALTSVLTPVDPNARSRSRRLERRRRQIRRRRLTALAVLLAVGGGAFAGVTLASTHGPASVAPAPLVLPPAVRVAADTQRPRALPEEI